MRHQMTAVIGGKRYNTETSTVIASNEYWDGSNYERGGTNTHLYRTKNGNYFVGFSTCWQGSRSSIQVVTRDRAQRLYEELPQHEEEYEAAFPGETVPDA